MDIELSFVEVTYLGTASRTVDGVRFEPKKTQRVEAGRWAQLAKRKTIAALLQEGVFLVGGQTPAKSENERKAAAEREQEIEQLKAQAVRAADLEQRIAQLEADLAAERAKAAPPPAPPTAPEQPTAEGGTGGRRK